MRYAFIQRHEKAHGVRRLCKVMDVHPSGYYAWKKQPISDKVRDDQRLLGLELELTQFRGHIIVCV